MYEDEGKDTIKIIDFGESMIMEEGKKHRETKGTFYYMAPEVLL